MPILIRPPMPRLPYSHYRHHHLALHAEWLCGFHAFVVLTPTEQIALHNFYEPSLELTDAQLRALRKRVTKADPSLPHRAGKAFARIAPFIGDGHPPMLGGTSALRRGQRKGDLRRVTVWGEVQPSISVERIAEILIFAVHEQIRRELKERDQDEAA